VPFGFARNGKYADNHPDRFSPHHQGDAPFQPRTHYTARDRDGESVVKSEYLNVPTKK
jgi:hypothetical protein